jgi:hypothetical protein
LGRRSTSLRSLVLEPINRYDVKPVSSQKTKSAITLSLRTRPSIEPMKAKSAALNLPACGWCSRYFTAYTTISVPTPVMRAANNVLKPSNRNESDRFSTGAHSAVTPKGPLRLTRTKMYVK